MNRLRISEIHITIFLCAIYLSGCTSKYPASAGGVPVEKALETFRVADGFKIEMIASEPLIADPVDMEIDEFGRLYVVEMHGYPLDKSGSGNVVLLSDRNGDGIMDERTMFCENLMLPTSIMRWKNGVLVTDAPNLLYLEDTDDDSKADVIDTLLHGFALTNPQHNVNTPVYGLDNYIHVANQPSVSTREYKAEFGDEGSEIVFYRNSVAPKLPMNAGGRSIRFRPDSLQIEMESSKCQFGQTFDSWGHRFACNNSNHGYHEVIANRYFQRNPYLPVSEAIQSMSDHLDAAEVFPITNHPDRQIFTNVGVMTSACGITIYNGAAFPPPYDGNIAFITEPVSNLVHVDILKDDGASFKASRLLQREEFLASTDAWARPVNLYVGPDGALYVVDYYRRVIESPEWMSEEAIHEGNLYDGSDKGRIFRITPKDFPKAEWTRGLDIGTANVEQLVKYLAHDNGWWRTNAQRLLIDRADKKALPLLEKMTANSKPFGRLHALWTLEGLGLLEAKHIQQALKDSIAGIRENAVLLAELHLDRSPKLFASLLSLEKDPDFKVRFQLLLTLGSVNTPESAEISNRLLFRNIDDKWMQFAALSAAYSQTMRLLNVVLQKLNSGQLPPESLVERLATMVGSGGGEKEIHDLLKIALKKNHASILSGIAEGFRARDSALKISPLIQTVLLKTIFDNASQDMRRSALRLILVNNITDSALKKYSVGKALNILADPAQPAAKKTEALQLLAVDDPSKHIAILQKMISPKEELPVQLAALETLSQAKGTAVSEFVIEQWSQLTIEMRDAAVNTFLVDSQRLVMLVDAMEKNQIQISSISFGTSVRIMLSDYQNIRERARVLFTRNEKEMKRISKEYQSVLDLKGDTAKGKMVYQQNCAICHQLRGKIGVAFGPDLGTVHNWTKNDILANILDPGLSIAGGYDMWEAKLTNGEIFQGIISSETTSAITFKNNGQPDRTISRKDIESLRGQNFSAMPNGFEKKIDKQQMADLIAFLRKP